MRGLRIFIGLFVVVIIALAVAGWSMPRHWQVQVHTRVAVAPAEALAWLADLQHWPDWTPWPGGMHYSYGKVATGAGAVLQWNDGASSGSIRITAYKPAASLVYVMHTDNSDNSRQCQLSAQAESGERVVRWQCGGELGANPFDRLLMLVVKPRIEQDMQRGLQRLSNHFAAQPQGKSP